MIKKRQKIIINKFFYVNLIFTFTLNSKETKQRPCFPYAPLLRHLPQVPLIISLRWFPGILGESLM